MNRWTCLVFAVSLLVQTIPVVTLDAQEGVVQPQQRAVQEGAGNPRASRSPGNRSPASEGSAEQTPGQGQEQAAADAAKAAAGESEKEKPPEEAATIQRPTQPARAPDPREFDVRPDENGRLRFSFHGQLWPDVLQWLAAASGQSLDWQELPNDHIHINSNRDMTLPEIRDLLNRLLFDRGFTLVVQGNILLVEKLEKLDPSLLRRVEDESELLDLPPHEFVKITFTLPDELKADQAATEIKPLLSTHAKVQPLLSTNRLLVVDIVANLREVSRIVNSEHAAAVGRIVPREFPIRFARADYVADQIMILLGLDPSSRRSPEELQVEQQRLQLFAQMQQRGADVSKYLRNNDAPTVFIAVNRRINAVVVNAPPKEMAIIERAVTLMDVPRGLAMSDDANALSMKRYPLATIKPESVVNALQSIGDLDPRSQLQIDSDAKLIFANATSADHEKLQAMIDKLDGTGRQFEVIWLRRLPADAVAATIQRLLVGEPKDEEQGSRRRYYSYYGYGGESEESKDDQGEFRVDADVKNNRLLLWANEAELTEVRSLLMKLGEIPGESGNPHRVRMFHTGDAAAAHQVLEQLRNVWPTVRENPLQIDEEASEPIEPSEQPRSENLPAEAGEPAVGESDRDRREDLKVDALSDPGQVGGNDQKFEDASTLVAQATSDEIFTRAQPAASPRSQTANTRPSSDSTAPVAIQLGADGRLLLRSQDTKALDYLEEMLERIAPPKKDYEVFYLKYASASLVTLNLEEFFDEEQGGREDNENSFWSRMYYGYSPEESDDKTPAGLNRRNPIRFIYDIDTNSVLVSNATSEQMTTVRSLIEIYDRPIPENSISARRFQLFKIRHARASDIAATIKDVYRDLLSSKDKVFERPGAQGDEKEQNSQGNNIYRVFGSMESEDKKPTTVKASFAGALSVGVDEVSNTLIVSAQEEWISSIAEMVRFLDVEALPYRNTVQVVNPGVDVATLQAALQRVMGDRAPTVTVRKDVPPSAPSATSPTPSADPVAAAIPD